MGFPRNFVFSKLPLKIVPVSIPRQKPTSCDEKLTVLCMYYIPTSSFFRFPGTLGPDFSPPVGEATHWCFRR